MRACFYLIIVLLWIDLFTKQVCTQNALLKLWRRTTLRRRVGYAEKLTLVWEQARRLIALMQSALFLQMAWSAMLMEREIFF